MYSDLQMWEEAKAIASTNATKGPTPIAQGGASRSQTLLLGATEKSNAVSATQGIDLMVTNFIYLKIQIFQGLMRNQAQNEVKDKNWKRAAMVLEFFVVKYNNSRFMPKLENL